MSGFKPLPLSRFASENEKIHIRKLQTEGKVPEYDAVDTDLYVDGNTWTKVGDKWKDRRPSATGIPTEEKFIDHGSLFFKDQKKNSDDTYYRYETGDTINSGAVVTPEPAPVTPKPSSFKYEIFNSDSKFTEYERLMGNVKEGKTMPKLSKEELTGYNIHLKEPGLYGVNVNYLIETYFKLSNRKPRNTSIANLMDHFKKIIDVVFPSALSNGDLIPSYYYLPNKTFMSSGEFSIKKEGGRYVMDKYHIKDIFAVVAENEKSSTIEKIEDINLDKDKFEGNSTSIREDENIDLNDKFLYEIKFDVCQGECGIIRLHYLSIQNLPLTESSVPFSENNSILIVNKIDAVLSDEHAKELLEIHQESNSIVFLETLLQDENFKLLNDNNFRRNLLEIFNFWEDADLDTPSEDDLKDRELDMKGLASNILSKYDAGIKSGLKRTGAIPSGELHGGSSHVKKYFSTLRKMYMNYMKRNRKTRTTMKKYKKKSGNRKTRKN
jgi:hypothetical protein